MSKIQDTDAARNALLVVYAMDMYTADKGNLTPAPDPRIVQDGWQVIGYLASVDVIAPRKGMHEQLKLSGQKVNYGYVAVSTAAPTRHVVVIRGTDGILEWIEDAEFRQVPYQDTGTHAEEGFYGIFQRMFYIDAASKQQNPDALAGIRAATQGSGPITVIGHSLGSTLATYTTLGLVRDEGISGRVSGCFLASPRPGDQGFANLFQQTLGSQYKVIDYELDIVPRVPFKIMGYATLPNMTQITLENREAKIKADVGCNHHAVCYAAMLDYSLRDWSKFPQCDQSCTQCIKGPN